MNGSLLTHEKYITVTEAHIDSNHHVNNVQYVHWVEEVATEHWEKVKHLTPYFNDFWVLSDHHIHYYKEVFLGEQLRVITYPQTPEGIRQPRKVEFYRGEQLVVDSRTIWVLMDGTTHKIKRITGDWLDVLK